MRRLSIIPPPPPRCRGGPDVHGGRTATNAADPRMAVRLVPDSNRTRAMIFERGWRLLARVAFVVQLRAAVVEIVVVRRGTGRPRPIRMRSGEVHRAMTQSIKAEPKPKFDGEKLDFPTFVLSEAGWTLTRMAM
jgi:hypothetical protein